MPPFTRVGSQVQSLPRPPSKHLTLDGFFEGGWASKIACLTAPHSNLQSEIAQTGAVSGVSNTNALRGESLRRWLGSSPVTPLIRQRALWARLRLDCNRPIEAASCASVMSLLTSLCTL